MLRWACNIIEICAVIATVIVMEAMTCRSLWWRCSASKLSPLAASAHF